VFPTTPLGTDAAGNSLGFSSRQQSQWGLDLTYRNPSGVVLQSEYYRSKLSNLEYDAWNVLLGYEVPAAGLPVGQGERKMLPGWKFYARYAEQNMDTPLTDNPLSWDTRQISLSVVQPIYRGVWLQYEYEFNLEDTNTGAKVDNDVFFLELFTGF
ncbi:MAG: hypothetical protein QHJ73_12820, partial [Armatimonadota bacterium]|nr:hypothetical protein [Armatimonadota bacterium]